MVEGCCVCQEGRPPHAGSTHRGRRKIQSWESLTLDHGGDSVEPHFPLLQRVDVVALGEVHSGPCCTVAPSHRPRSVAHLETFLGVDGLQLPRCDQHPTLVVHGGWLRMRCPRWCGFQANVGGRWVARRAVGPVSLAVNVQNEPLRAFFSAGY
jgi:hypothetical protein